MNHVCDIWDFDIFDRVYRNRIKDIFLSSLFSLFFEDLLYVVFQVVNISKFVHRYVCAYYLPITGLCLQLERKTKIGESLYLEKTWLNSSMKFRGERSHTVRLISCTTYASTRMSLMRKSLSMCLDAEHIYTKLLTYVLIVILEYLVN